mgnify:CR=1 FL=1|tara:strand:- start:5 stop:409 length:405 start_codon:yes stop_codon:yes gene_type:complete
MNAGKFVKDEFESLAAISVIRTLRVFPSNLGTMNADGSFSGGQPDINGAALDVATVVWTAGQPGTLTNSNVLLLDGLHGTLPVDTDASIGSLAVTGSGLLSSSIMGIWNVTDPIIIPAGDFWEFAIGELSFSIL